MQQLFALSMILLTVGSYFIMNKIYQRYAYAFLIPALTATTFIIIILSIFHISYESYMTGGQWINAFLGPSVVALAYPLYKQRHFLMQNLSAILGSVVVGAISGMASIGLFAKMFGVQDSLILSLIPKSITTPVAIEIAKGLGGNASMTIVGVMMAGIFGAVAAPAILKFTRVDSPMGRGIALGSASHALGTSKAAEYSELTFSMSSVTMTLCAIIGSFLGPIVVWVLHI